MEESCLNEQVVKDIAAKHNKTPAQVVLRWGIQRGTAIIPKTTKEERLKENLDLFNGFNLSNDEMN
jgi:D-xylose reductase